MWQIKNLKAIYYGVVSLITFFVLVFTLIDLGIILANSFLITDEEYLASHYWVYEMCKNSSNFESCIENKKRQILLQRSYDFKTSLFRDLITLLIVFPLFGYHFVKFKELK